MLIGITQLRLLKQLLLKYYQIWGFTITNCNMPPEMCHTHLLRILISVNGNTESFYRLSITSANRLMEQFRNPGILSKFQ